MRIGCRPGGISRIVLIDRSPYTVRASVRGIGVAVSASVCGSPPRALGLERRALADAESMLLVDDRQPEARELDRLADDGVRPDHDLRHPAGDRVVDLALAFRA